MISRLIPRTPDAFSGLVLFVLGFLALVYQLVSLLGIVDGISSRWITELTLAVVSLLAVSLGFDRWVLERRLEAKLDGIQHSADRALGGIYLKGSDSIWAHTLSTVSAMETSLVSVVVGMGPRAPDWWSQGVIERLAATARNGNGATWDVYLQAPPEFELPLTAKARFDAMESAGVLDQFDLWHLPFGEKSGFDFFLIDRRHVYLTIPTRAGLPDPHRAIYFRDAPDLAEQLDTWLSGLEKSKLPLSPPALD